MKYNVEEYGKYPILKISKISDIFELENIGYISDIYHQYISPIYIVPTLLVVGNNMK